MQHRFVYILLFLSFVYVNAYSQFSDRKIILTTEVPIETLYVGEDPGDFFVTVKNTLHDNLVKTVTYTITQPEGIEIVPSSIELKTTRTDAVAISSMPLTKPNELTVTITIPDGLDFDQDLKIGYKAVAKCGIIPLRGPQEKVKTLVVKNSIVCNYTNASGVNVFKSSDGSQVITNSYNILYADLMLMLTNADTHVEGYRYVENTSRIPVLNALGAGNTKHIRVLVTSDEVNTQYRGAVIYNYNAQTGAGVPITRKLLSGNVFYYDIDTDVLKKIGFTDGTLKASEGFVIKETIWISGNAYTIEKKYQTQWGTSYDNICNNDPVAQANGSATVYYENKVGVPVCTGSYNSVYKPSFCGGTGDEGKIRFTFKNTATRANEGMFDIYNYISCSGLKITGVYRDADNDGVYEQVVTTTGSNTSYLYITFDKNSGFKDIKGDKTFNDLGPGEDITFEVRYELLPYSSSVSSFNRTIQFIFTYYNNFRNYYNSTNQYVRDFTGCSYNVPTGSVDLFTGKPNQRYSWYFDYWGYQGQLSEPCSKENTKIYAELKLPKGYKLNDNKVYVNNQVVIPSINSTGDIITIQPPLQYNKLSAGCTYGVNLDIDCLDGVKSGTGQLNWSSHYLCDNNCTSTGLSANIEQKVFAHCSNGCLQNVDITFERASFGWKTAGHVESSWKMSDLTDDKKIDLSRDDKKQFNLDRAYVYDNVTATITGDIGAGCTYNTLHAQISYTSPVADNIFDVNKDIISIKIGDITYSGDAISFTQSFDNTTKQCLLDFKVTGIANVTGKVVATISLTINNKIGVGSGYSINDIRGQLQLKQDDELTIEESLGLKNLFYIYNPYSYKCNGQEYSEVGVFWQYCSSYILGWNNEYRPVSHFSKFELQLPATHKVKSVVVGRDELVKLVEGVNFKIDAANKFTVIPESLPFFDGYAIIKILFYVDCASSTTSTSQLFDVAFSQNDYASADVNSAHASDFSTIKPIRPDYIDKRTVTFDPIKKPLLGLEVERYQPGIKNKVRWVTRVVEKNKAPSPSTWMAFEPRSTNKSTIKLEKVYKEDGKTEFPATSIKKFGNGGLLVDIGSIVQNGYNKVILEASYTNCEDGSTDQVDVLAGWDPVSVNITSPSEYPTACIPMSDHLDLAMKAANMQWEVKQVESAKTYNIGEEVKYVVDLKSTGIANMYNVKFGLKLPGFASLSNGGIGVSYYYKNALNEDVVENYTIKSTQINTVNGDYFPLESIVTSLAENSAVGGFLGNSHIVLTFGVNTVCGFDAGSMLQFKASGNTNCNDLLTFNHDRRIPITGFSNLENIKAYIQNIVMSKWNEPTNVKMNFQNIGLTNITPSQIEVTLSEGLSYVAHTASAELGEPTINGQKLTWNWPVTLPLLPKQSKAFNFSVITSGPNCNIKESSVSASVYTKQYSGTCEIKGTYDTYTQKFYRPLFTLGTPAAPVSVNGVVKVCEGTGAMKFTHIKTAPNGDVPVSSEWSIWKSGSSVPEVVSGEPSVAGAIASIVVDESGDATITWATRTRGRYEIKVRERVASFISDYSTSLVFEIVTKPTIPLGIDGKLEVCAGSIELFKVTDSPLQTKYSWTKDGNDISGNSQVAINFAATTLPVVISVKVINEVCGNSESITKTITVNPLPNATFTGFENKTYCIDGSVVNLSPTIAGGKFSGNGISTEGTGIFTPFDAKKGTHTITYTLTENGCTSTSSQLVTVTTPDVRILNLKTEYCKNTPAFELTGSPLGGTFTITEKDKPEIETTTFNNEQKEGVFTVLYRYSDVNGCSGSAQQVVTVNGLPSATIVSDREIEGKTLVCANDQVELTATPSGGRAPYQFRWSANDSKEKYLQLKATETKDYTVTVFDNNLCYADKSYTVEVLPIPEIKIESITPVSCKGISDGKLSFSINYTGLAGLKYSVTPGHETLTGITTGAKIDLDNLPYGYSLVEVITNDAYQCKGRSTPNIYDGGPKFKIEPDAIICAGYDNEPTPVYFKITATRVLPSSTGTFKYEINGKAADGVFGAGVNKFGPIMALPGDDYVFTVTGLDNLSINKGENSCTIQPIKGKVRSADMIIEAVTQKRLVQCKPNDPKEYKARVYLTDNTTELDATALAFNLEYENNGVYTTVAGNEWKPAESGNTITFTNLTQAGNYRIVVRYRKKEGCVQPLFFKVEESKLAVSYIKHDVTCFGNKNGSIEALAKGTIGEIDYSWTNEKLTVAQRNQRVLTDIDAGSYGLSIKDVETGCTAYVSENIIINEPTALQMPDIFVDNSKPCEPYAKMAGGGTPPYTFVWIKKTSMTHRISDILKGRFPNLNIGDESKGAEAFREVITGFDSEFTDQYVSRPPQGEIIPGAYWVEVIDIKGCRVKMTEAKDVTPKVGKRTYDIAFRWVSSTREVNPVSDPVDKTKSSISSSGTSQYDPDLGKCAKVYAQKREIDLDEYCHTPEKLTDNFTISYDDAGHNSYTLYYYDKAGNLVRTVAPEGVVFAANREEEPKHNYKTNYYYNSLGQVVSQETPDAGQTQFWYNVKGQLRFSQNAQQRIDGTFSYSKYDELGRVFETGIYKGTVGVINDAIETDNTKTYEELSAVERFPSKTSEPIQKLLSERTETFYSSVGIDADNKVITWNGSVQRYLLNRVSQVNSYTKTGEKISTYYSYDPHGNVEWIVNEMPGLGKTGVDYAYDLISNKVTKVSMNQKRKDSFFHQYEYDEDNRLKQVFSSVNGLLWSKDATYYYFDHGPLKRVELGQGIQGIDYTYTLNGWLKAINTPDLDYTDDKAKGFARDLFGMTLGYYDNDFVKEGSKRFTSADPNKLVTDKNLYNGNISTWVTSALPAMEGMLTTDITGINYSYDMLNRIKSADFNIYDKTNLSFTSLAGKDYAENFSYDLNGNITALTRNGFGNKLEMDKLTYHYNNKEGEPLNNRLKSITDEVGDTDYDDIKTQGADGTDNYVYDAIGNLIENKQDKIKITWNSSGKISEISPYKGSEKPHIVYWYDAAGNRVRKQVNTAPVYDAFGLITGEVTDPTAVTTTYYLRDAQGNTLGVYERRNEVVVPDKTYKAIYTLSEIPLYGSDRLGMFTPKIGDILSTVEFAKADMYKVKLDLSPVPILQGEASTMLVASTQTVTATDGTSADKLTISSIESNGDTYSTKEKLSFTGNQSGAIAFGEDEQQTLQFYVVPVSTYLGAANPTVLVFNANNELMANSGNLDLDPEKKCVVVRIPGDGSETYLLLGTNSKGDLVSNTIEMSLNNGLGDIVNKNTVVATGGYEGNMIATTDNTAKTITLLATRTSGTDLELQTLQYVTGAWQTPKVQLTVPSIFGAANMQYSPDGSKLLLYAYTSTEHLFGIHTAEIQQYVMGKNFTFNQTAVGRIPLLQATRNSMAEFTTENNIAYSTTTLSNTPAYYYDSKVDKSASVLDDAGASIRLLSDGNLLFGKANSQELYLYNPASKTGVATASLSQGQYTGSITDKLWSITMPSNGAIIDNLTVGQRSYELKDHLGNVRVVVADKLDANKQPEVKASYQYYAFGSVMPGRYGSGNLVGAGGYRYGFNGKEKDDNITGKTGAIYDYGFRIYDARIAKFLSIDPLTKKYPWYTPYQFAGNTPIQALDIDGLENIYYGNVLTMKGFSGSNTLRLATSEGIKTEMQIWGTEKAKVKHDVYLVALDNKAFSLISTGEAFTVSFKNDHLSDKGTYTTFNKTQTESMALPINLLPEISKLTFQQSKDGERIISVVFINKDKFENSDIEYQALIVHHEIKAHIVSRIGKENDIYNIDGKKEHEVFHGVYGDMSPRIGKEKAGTPQRKFIEEMKNVEGNNKDK